MDKENESGKSSNGGGSSKRPKIENKLKKRGLGIAMLEKIRISEELQMNLGAGTASIKPSYNNNLPFILPKLPNSNNQPSFPQIPIFHPSTPMTTVPLPNNSSGGGGGGFAGQLGFKSVPKDFGMDPGLGFLSNLLYQSNPSWTLPEAVKKNPQYQVTSPSPLAIFSSGTSVTPVPPPNQAYARSYVSSSRTSGTTVPPSDQPFTRSYVPILPRVTGIKRPYPYSMDLQPASSLNFKLPPFAAAPKTTNETISFGSGSGIEIGGLGSAFSKYFRDVPSGSKTNSNPSSSKGKGIEENFNGGYDFLKLAPPRPPTPSTHQEIKEDQTPSPKEYIFFPPAENAAHAGDMFQYPNVAGGDEDDDEVDLNLKL
ncbi:hypothetical protein RIF29_30958 [Crotalaria pallida]|uniref:Uncharacterized protein n=1 Tax=Crotalaria pallida TaxID=3830 RepID=A0AAN9EGP9_CROPI